MKPIFIGIAGGSGAGKSTVCTALIDKYPEKIGLIQLDDYFKPEADVPTVGALTNWDHPDSIYLDKLAADLEQLSEGKTVTIMTKSARLNPDWEKTHKRIPVPFAPKPIMLVEGYLIFYNENIRKQFTTMIWLDVPHDVRWARRVHFKFPEYEEKVLIPMHEKYVEPTKQFAQHVIDTSELDKGGVLIAVEKIALDLLR